MVFWDFSLDFFSFEQFRLTVMVVTCILATLVDLVALSFIFLSPNLLCYHLSQINLYILTIHLEDWDAALLGRDHRRDRLREHCPRLRPLRRLLRPHCPLILRGGG